MDEALGSAIPSPKHNTSCGNIALDALDDDIRQGRRGTNGAEPPDQIRHMQHRILVDHERPILTMGRGVANHLIVDDPLVSRMHARIELQRNRFMLIDQSTNGTFLKIQDADPIFLRRDAIQLEG